MVLMFIRIFILDYEYSNNIDKWRNESFNVKTIKFKKRMRSIPQKRKN